VVGQSDVAHAGAKADSQSREVLVGALAEDDGHGLSRLMGDVPMLCEDLAEHLGVVDRVLVRIVDGCRWDGIETVLPAIGGGPKHLLGEQAQDFLGV